MTDGNSHKNAVLPAYAGMIPSHSLVMMVKDYYFISPNKEYANKFAQDEIDYLKQDKRFKEIDLEALKEDINE